MPDNIRTPSESADRALLMRTASIRKSRKSTSTTRLRARAPATRRCPEAVASMTRTTPTVRRSRAVVEEAATQGLKTHEQQLRILEKKPDMPDARQDDLPPTTHPVSHPDARQSEFPVSQGGMNQESDHNKHNDTGQQGHQPQKHSPAEEKQD
jgi:hypothetical protein